MTILLNPPPQVPARAGDGTAARSLELLLAAAPGGRDWRDDALCAQTDPAAFYPARGDSPNSAKRICGRCPVQPACLEHALAHDERFGIWGGMSPAQRRNLAQRRAHALPATSRETGD